MATVVKGARTSQTGIASSRLKVDMGDLYKLEDDQGALMVTTQMLGKSKAGNYEVKWHTTELRPKATTFAASAANSDLTIQVTDPSYIQVNDILKVPATGETMLVTSTTATTAAVNATVTRTWGATAATSAAAALEILIVAPHYGENATLQNGRTVTEVLYSNNVALWRHNFQISGTLQAISEQGGTYNGSDVDLQREQMLLTHKRDINLALLFSEYGSSGDRRSMSGAVEFIDVNGTSRTDSTSAVTFSVFATNSEVMTRFNGGKMVGVVSRQFATIVSKWAITTSGATVQVQNGASMFGLQVMDITTPHGQFRLLIDDAFSDSSTYKKYGLFISTDKVNGPKWRYLRDTRLLKDRQAPDQDGYEEEVLTEATVEWGNPNYHYLYKNAQTAS